MINLTTVHLQSISEPRPYPITYLRNSVLYPILICGIVNPNGPTLSLVTVIKDKTSAPLALAYAYLNPFCSELFVLGYFREGLRDAPVRDQILDDLRPLQIFAKGTPSLCIPGGIFEASDVRYLYSHLFQTDKYLHDLLDGLKRFPLNPWDRVTEEVQTARAQFSSDQVSPLDNSKRIFSESDMNTLLDIVLDVEHNEHEIPAFACAWRGSIDQQRECGNEKNADNALQYDEFVSIFTHILESSEHQFKPAS